MSYIPVKFGSICCRDFTLLYDLSRPRDERFYNIMDGSPLK